MQNLLSSARLKDLSRRLGYTYSNFQSLWDDAVEEASDLGEGDNLGYILRILRELIGIPEKEFQKATQNFIEQSYLSSSITDWNAFLESEGMIKSDIPQKDIPEVVNKKDRKELKQESKQSLTDIINRAEENGLLYFGIRAEGIRKRIGEILDVSEIYDDDRPTGEYLRGTSATTIEIRDHWGYRNTKISEYDLIKKAYEYNKKYYSGKYRYLIGSERQWFGEDDKEVVMKDPLVLADLSAGLSKYTESYDIWLKEAIEEEVISSFLQNIGLADKDKDTSLKYLDVLQTYLVEPLETEDQKNLMSEFIDLLRKQIEETISEEDKTKLVEYLKALFPDKKGEMTEDVLDDVNAVFGSAFGPIGSRLGDFFSLTKDIVSDIADAAGDDLDKIKDYLNDRKKEKESGESDGKDDTDSDAKTEPDFDLTDDAQKAKDQEKQDAKDLTPDEFHQKYGKCPKGYEFDSEKQACVKKEVKQKPAKKSSKKSSKKTPKKI